MPAGYGEICLLQTVHGEGAACCFQRPVCEHAFAETPWDKLHRGTQNNVGALPLRNFQATNEKKVYFKEMCCFQSVEGCAGVGKLKISPKGLTNICSCYTLLGSKGLALNVFLFFFPPSLNILALK